MIARRFLRFAVVGAAGFLVDAGVLLVLILFGADPYLARVPSFAMAVTVTWALNRGWTYSDRMASMPGRTYGRYFAVQVSGAALNFAIYWVVLSIIGPGAAESLLALVAGSAVAMVTNFAGAHWFAFGPERPSWWSR